MRKTTKSGDLAGFVVVRRCIQPGQDVSSAVERDHIILISPDHQCFSRMEQVPRGNLLLYQRFRHRHYKGELVPQVISRFGIVSNVNVVRFHLPGPINLPIVGQFRIFRDVCGAHKSFQEHPGVIRNSWAECPYS